MSSELREFVYLDSMSVNSLLASQYMAVPETVRDISEDLDRDEDNKGVSGGVTIPGIGNIGGKWGSGNVEEIRQSVETERRVNDQYRFSILHQALASQDQLIDLNETDEVSLSQGEAIKISGSCETDPFYRLLSAISLMSRMFDNEAVSEESEGEIEEMLGEDGELIFDQWRDLLHGERIGLKMVSDEFRYPIVMAIESENLWVNSQREFLGTHDYTVVGRVDQVLNGQEKWDFIDLLKIVKSVFSEDTVDTLRDALLEVGENISEIGSDDEMAFNVDIEEGDYVVDEPAIVISPIAIYW